MEGHHRVDDTGVVAVRVDVPETNSDQPVGMGS